jgi:hypothetical protein
MHKKDECQAANPATCRNHGTAQPDDFIAKLKKKKSKIQPLEKGLNDLATVNPVLAAEWHPTKNGNLTPEDYKAISAHKVWWQCPEGHEWYAKITDRNTGRGRCKCEPVPLESGVNDLATVNPTLAAEWHPTKNGKLTPQTIKALSRKKVWWLGKCGHEFDIVLADRNAGNGCPTCSGRVLLAGLNDLATINPEAAKDWHPTLNGKLTPQDVRANESRLVWWQCPVKEHHTWEALVSSRNNGTLCPHCPHKTSKAEDTVREYIESLNHEVQSSNRKILKGKEIDIYIPSLKVGIEFNGVYWHSEGGGKKDTQYHYNKWSNCGKVGVELIQIWEDDWVSSPELVLKSLSRRLGAKTDSASAANLTTQSISEEEAERFLKSNDLTGFKAGTHYHGSVDGNGDLKSVFSLEKVSDSQMNIVQYVSNTDVNGDLKELLQHARETHGVTSFTVTVDNCTGEGSIYKNAGFIETKVEPADYKYLVRGKRISSSVYTPEKFRDDPALEWEDGLTEKELADLNGLNRIWDAGKTTYEFNII